MLDEEEKEEKGGLSPHEKDMKVLFGCAWICLGLIAVLHTLGFILSMSQ